MQSDRRTYAPRRWTLDARSGITKSRFFTLDLVGQLPIKEARIAANKKLNAMRTGEDPRAGKQASAASQAASAEKPQPEIPIGDTPLRDAVAYYVANRNCAKISKDSLVSSLPELQRVKSVPLPELRKLVASFPSYPGNKLHPLLCRLLLATGLRVGITMSCQREFIKAARIEIPASTNRSKVRWNKRHLEHLAKIIPRTPEINQILTEIEAVAPEYGDAETWLFPSRTAESGHMEEEKAVTPSISARSTDSRPRTRCVGQRRGRGSGY